MAILYLSIDAKKAKEGAAEFSGAAGDVARAATGLTASVGGTDAALEQLGVAQEDAATATAEMNARAALLNRTLEETARKTQAQTDRQSKGNQETEKSHRFFGLLDGKLKQVAQIGPQIFAADLLARVAGFNNSMQLIDKVLDTVAKGLRSLAIDEAFDKGTKSIKEANAALDEHLKKLKAAQDQKFGTLDIGQGRRLQLGGLVDDAEALKLVDEATRRIKNIRQTAELGPFQGPFQTTTRGVTVRGQRAPSARDPIEIRDEAIQIEAEFQGHIRRLAEVRQKQADVLKKAAGDQGEVNSKLDAEVQRRKKLQDTWIANDKRWASEMEEASRRVRAGRGTGGVPATLGFQIGATLGIGQEIFGNQNFLASRRESEARALREYLNQRDSGVEQRKGRLAIAFAGMADEVKLQKQEEADQLERTNALYMKAAGQAERLGTSIAGAIERGILEAKNLGEALKMIFRDIALALIRQFITEKAASSLASAFLPAFLGPAAAPVGAAGGGGGFIPPGIGGGGWIGAGAGGGGRTVIVNQYIQTPDIAGFRYSQRQLAENTRRMYT